MGLGATPSPKTIINSLFGKSKEIQRDILYFNTVGYVFWYTIDNSRIKLYIMSKLLVISNNKIDVSFWYTYLNPKSVEVKKTGVDKNLLNHLKRDTPDLILLDDYFETYNNGQWMRQIIVNIQQVLPSKKIICLSPKFCQEDEFVDRIGFQCHSFNETFISDLKQGLN
ncbi:MAG: hypothetical protein ACI865_002066 [Flavobacteriaceae bacterium]